MVAHVNTVAFSGIDVLPIEVQVAVAGGLPTFTIVGLPDKAVGESRERVRAALNAIGLALPAKRITVNLAPADVQKEGSHFDLPIALGLLTAMGVIAIEDMAQYTALGELGLICPGKQGGEAAWAGGADILAPNSLLELINHFKGTGILSAPKPAAPKSEATFLDLTDIKGQESAKRALEIAATLATHNSPVTKHRDARRIIKTKFLVRCSIVLTYTSMSLRLIRLICLRHQRKKTQQLSQPAWQLREMFKPRATKAELKSVTLKLMVNF